MDSDLNTLASLDVWEHENEFINDVYAHSRGAEAEDMEYWQAEYDKQIAANS